MIVYIDMDDVLCDYRKSHKTYIRKFPQVRFPQSIPGFFENLRPVKDAVDSVNRLRKMERLDVYILTAPSARNPLSYTEKRVWIEKYFGYEFTKKLIICPNKGLLKGDILIDDNISGKGQEAFEGKLIHFGSDEFCSWKRIMEILFTELVVDLI